MAALSVNGTTHQVNVDADTPLLWVLRETIGLRGTEDGWGKAQCGASSMSNPRTLQLRGRRAEHSRAGRERITRRGWRATRNARNSLMVRLMRPDFSVK